MTFEEFVSKKDAARAAAPPRVTWRKVSADTGGGWSGIAGHGTALIARIVDDGAPGSFRVWLLRDGRPDPSTVVAVRDGGLAAAKKVGASLLAGETQ